MPQRQTSTGKLSELARHVVLPSGIASTGWPAVRDKCAEVDTRFDEWQDGLGRAILAKRESGLYAAGIGGVVISICRQAGKTYSVGAIVAGLCLIFPGMKVLWTAHRSRTSDETFGSLQGMVKRKKIAPHVLHIRLGNGQQEIGFVNGSRILFGARESGFGRGFDDVDVLVFDEAQILSQKALDDMVPATNVSPNPLILMMGTPPKPSDPSEAFSIRRAKALSGSPDEDALYVEFSADRLAKPDDRAQWRMANPSYPHRTPEASMLRMKKILGDESFLREGLGIWASDEVTQWAVIGKDAWGLCKVTSPPDGRRGYGLDMSPDRLVTSIGVAERPVSGPTHLEVAARWPGTGGSPVDWLVERWPTAAAVVIDEHSPAMSLKPELERRHVKVTVMRAPDMAKACGMVSDGVRDGTLTHADQKELNDALAGATTRPIGQAGGWGWDRRSPAVDLTPLVGVTVALFGVMTSRRRGGARASRGREAILL